MLFQFTHSPGGLELGSFFLNEIVINEFSEIQDRLIHRQAGRQLCKKVTQVKLLKKMSLSLTNNFQFFFKSNFLLLFRDTVRKCFTPIFPAFSKTVFFIKILQ